MTSVDQTATRLSDIPSAELPALVEQGLPLADYIAEMARREIDWKSRAARGSGPVASSSSSPRASGTR